MLITHVRTNELLGGPGELAIDSRARLAEKLTSLVESDGRVSKCRVIDFAQDGGVLLAVDLRPGLDRMAGKALARELEFELAMKLPALLWVRVEANSKA